MGEPRQQRLNSRVPFPAAASGEEAAQRQAIEPLWPVFMSEAREGHLFADTDDRAAAVIEAAPSPAKSAVDERRKTADFCGGKESHPAGAPGFKCVHPGPDLSLVIPKRAVLLGSRERVPHGTEHEGGSQFARDWS